MSNLSPPFLTIDQEERINEARFDLHYARTAPARVDAWMRLQGAMINRWKETLVALKVPQ